MSIVPTFRSARPALRIAAIVILLGSAAALAQQPFAQHDLAPPSPIPQTSPANALTVARISTEPDPEEQARSLRWSADGQRVAWTRLVVPPEPAHGKLPQREILTFTPDSTSLISVLVPAAIVTATLRGTATPPPINPDEHPDSNPLLLEDIAWSPDHTHLLLASTQSLAWLDVASQKSSLLVSGNDPISAVTLSPDGRTVAFIRAHGLWLITVPFGPASVTPARAFAIPSHANILEGEADWTYRQELHMPRAYWWSPDSRRIAWLQTDDSAVAKYALHSSDGTPREIAYPKPGADIPLVHLFTRTIDGGPAIAIYLDPAKDTYLPIVSWLPDSRRIAVERLDRFQHTLQLLITEAVTNAAARVILTESDKYWINLADNLRFLNDGSRFLWTSERSGYRHLYLYDLAGNELAQLTHGDWEVTHLDAIDQSRGFVYLTATEKNPIERQLYRVPLDGSALTRISQSIGTHQSFFAPTALSYVDIVSTSATPPQLSLHSPDPSSHPSPAPDANTSKSTGISALQPTLQPVEFFTLKLHLGAEAHAFLIRPPGFAPTKKYPVIVYFAGGPGEQIVRDRWTGSTGLWMQLMAQKGFLVFALDNQGTSGRGHAFEHPIHFRFSAQELIDQRDGIAYLSGLPYVDKDRIGACGWGYGGFLVIHAMLDRPIQFKAGFAGAPIVDWRTYDATFGERYLDDSNIYADGWAASSAIENARYLRGPLMIAQGTEDELVHVENTLSLQEEFLDAGKSASFLILAGRGHEITDAPARLVLYTQMTDFFVNNL